VLFSIYPDVDTLHETHVNIEDEGVMLTCVSVNARSSTPEGCDANGAMEIGDGRWFVARSKEEDVVKFRSWTKGADASRNRFRRGAIGKRQAWHPNC